MYYWNVAYNFRFTSNYIDKNRKVFTAAYMLVLFNSAVFALYDNFDNFEWSRSSSIYLKFNRIQYFYVDNESGKGKTNVRVFTIIYYDAIGS